MTRALPILRSFASRRLADNGFSSEFRLRPVYTTLPSSRFSWHNRSQLRCFTDSPVQYKAALKQQQDDSENFWKVAADDSAFWDAYVSTRPNYSDEFYAEIYNHHAAHSNSFELAHDVGCGAGQVSVALASRYRHVIASDINDTHIAVAQRRVGPILNVSRVSYKHTTGEDLHTHFAPESADLVAAAEAIVLMDEHQALSGFHKILRPGGTLALWFYGRPTFSNPDLRQAAQPIIDAIMIRNWSKVIQGSGDKRKAGFKRAADGMASWLDYVAFDSKWKDVKRIKWNTFATLPFFGEAACGFPVDVKNSVKPGERTEVRTDPNWWRNEWDLVELKRYYSVLFPGFKEAIGDGDEEVDGLFKKLESKMGGQRIVHQFTWPAVLVLATKN